LPLGRGTPADRRAVWVDGRGDKAFRSALRLVTATCACSIDGVLFCGDTVTLGRHGGGARPPSVADACAVYRAAFTAPGLSALLASTPCRFVAGVADLPDARPLLPPPSTAHGHRRAAAVDEAARHAATVYQVSHSAAMAVVPGGDRLAGAAGAPGRSWYTWTDGCVVGFATDVRTGRRVSRSSSRGRLLDAAQFQALVAFLGAHPDRVKVVLSAVPFAPDGVGGAAGWAAEAPDQRVALLNYIADVGARRVLFLSGGAAASTSMVVASAGEGAGATVVAATSGPWFGPYPPPPPQRRASRPRGGALRLPATGAVTAEDNYTEVTVGLTEVVFSLFSRRGGLLNTTTHGWAGRRRGRGGRSGAGGGRSPSPSPAG